MLSNSMLLFPRLIDGDIYDTRGKSKDEINTFIEYFYQIILGYKDTTPEDEDGNTSNDYVLLKVFTVKVCQIINTEPIQQEKAFHKIIPPYYVYEDVVLYDGVRNIVTPPPEA